MTISVTEAGKRWPDAMVAWDQQCTRMHQSEALRFHCERNHLYASARAPAGWLPANGSPKRSVSGNVMWSARWEPEVGVWSLARVDISSYPRHNPDLRPWSLEYSEYPKNRIEDFVGLTIGVDPLPGLVTAVFTVLAAMPRVPYSDEGMPLITQALADALEEGREQRRRAAEFEASFRPPTF